MTDSEISISLQDDGRADAYIDLLTNVSEFVGTVTTRTANTVKEGLLSDLAQEPGVPSRKLQFTSTQQRKKVFAARLHGPRSHAISQGWKVEVILSAWISTIALTNAAPETIYVVGIHQQKWHKETGWYYVPTLAEKWGVILVKEGNRELSQAWAEVRGRDATRK